MNNAVVTGVPPVSPEECRRDGGYYNETIS